MEGGRPLGHVALKPVFQMNVGRSVCNCLNLGTKPDQHPSLCSAGLVAISAVTQAQTRSQGLLTTQTDLLFLLLLPWAFPQKCKRQVPRSGSWHAQSPGSSNSSAASSGLRRPGPAPIPPQSVRQLAYRQAPSLNTDT